MKTILTVENIEKYYGNRSNITKAVDNISFSVDEGEFIGVMGPSGSGKTTLLNCISTIDTVTSGHIYINGDVYKRQDWFQRNTLYPFSLYFLLPCSALPQHHSLPQPLPVPVPAPMD